MSKGTVHTFPSLEQAFWEPNSCYEKWESIMDFPGQQGLEAYTDRPIYKGIATWN